MEKREKRGGGEKGDKGEKEKREKIQANWLLYGTCMDIRGQLLGIGPLLSSGTKLKSSGLAVSLHTEP